MAKAKQKTWAGEVEMAVTVIVGGVPARSAEEAAKRILLVAEHGLTGQKKVTVWKRRRGGLLNTFGAGRRLFVVKNPVLCGVTGSEAEVTDVECETP